MTKRMISMLLIVGVVLAIIGSVKYFQIRAAMAQGGYRPPPEAVTTVVAAEVPWESTLSAIGSVAAVNGVTVTADLPGVVDSIEFDSGRAVQKGDLLVRLDVKQEKAQLAAAEAQRELSRVNMQRTKDLLVKEIVPQAVYDQVAAEQKQAIARVGEIQATIDRKIIRAPFSGVLGIRQVNVGQYVASGAPIVALQSLQPVYVHFSIPQQDAGLVKIGAELRVTTDAMEGREVGKVTALDSVVDEATRNLLVEATFVNQTRRLRPGMFVEAELDRGVRRHVIALPVSAINYAPFGNSVFIVEEVKGPDGKSYRGVRQQFVKLGDSRGDQVAVVSGVKAGEEVVTSGVFKLRPGAAVEVNNSIQPSNSSAPNPENS